MATTPLWRPDDARIEQANLTAFRRAAQERWGRRLDDFAALYRWSIEERAEFWTSVTEYCGVLGQGLDGPALEQGDRMPGARWFPRARLNFAENLLRAPRRRRRPGLLGRGPRAATAELGRPARPGLAAGRGPGRGRGGPGGSRGGAICPTCPRRWPPCWPPPASARSGPPAPRTSASRACWTASARSSRGSCWPPTATTSRGALTTAWAGCARSRPGCPRWSRR